MIMLDMLILRAEWQNTKQEQQRIQCDTNLNAVAQQCPIRKS